jgi:hypothetical protein
MNPNARRNSMTYVTRYRPFNNVFALPRELDRMMDEALGSWGRGGTRGTPPPRRGDARKREAPASGGFAVSENRSGSSSGALKTAEMQGARRGSSEAW